MNRRQFLKTLSVAGGATVFAPSSFDLLSMYKSANAAVDYEGAGVVAPAVMPQVINIFLYGGASELAGNLTNIAEINVGSQNKYDSRLAFGPGILLPETDINGLGQITPNGFWKNAGGVDMEFMLGKNYMSVYRTVMKRKNPTRSHRESVLMSLKGSLDIDVSAGVGTRIAAVLFNHAVRFQGATRLADGTLINNILSDLSLPFVSFVAETPAFASEPDFTIPLELRSTTLSETFNDPFTRNNDINAAALEAIVANTVTAADRSRFNGVDDAFVLRAKLATQFSGLKPVGRPTLTQDTSGNTLPTLTDSADAAVNGGSQLSYPDNDFTDRIRAAVTLAVENPGSLYITVGGGLGGWDDHNNGVDRYPGRMNDLMAVLRSAMLHIKYSNTLTPGNLSRTTTRNIVVNVFGDFGRRVNLNNSEGWDHGNNQNLYTFGGAAVRPNGAAALGKIVGVTKLVGAPGTNNQFTEPAPGSYEFEPMSVAASVYSYFGVQKPQLLTVDPERNPQGDLPIDETQTGV